ncbi:MAG: hypothetical protein ACKPGI_16120, partial [Verrucomicrobiota bacterium]
SPNLPRVVRGEEAIKALGGNLPAVARAHRRTPDQLNLQLRIDRALAVVPRDASSTRIRCPREVCR